ncbi:unnamed protein product, partial [Ectocarpus fasciculatus]
SRRRRLRGGRDGSCPAPARDWGGQQTSRFLVTSTRHWPIELLWAAADIVRLSLPALNARCGLRSTIITFCHMYHSLCRAISVNLNLFHLLGLAAVPFYGTTFNPGCCETRDK